MGEVFRLRVVEAEGSFWVGLERAGQSAPGVHLPTSTVQALLDTHSGHLRHAREAPGILVRGRDAQVTQGETLAGQALAPLLRGHLPAGGVLVVDAQGASAQAASWELLATEEAPPFEASEAAVVARLLPGTPPKNLRHSERLRIRTVLVQDTPTDPQVAQVAQAVWSATQAAGLPAPVAHIDAEDGDLVVLHLVAHGEQAGDLFELVRGGEGVDALLARLPGLPRVDLVVASICHAGRSSEVVDLPSRLLQSGVPACVAPRGSVRSEAAATFVWGLYQALGAGQDVVAAVAAGRRAVRGLALPHPDARWHLFTLAVSHLDWVSAPPRRVPTWRPPGWPEPAPDAARLLAAVARAGEEVGYVGIEQLAMVLAGHPDLPAELRSLIQPQAQSLLRLRRLSRQETTGPLVVSPWLTHLGRDLKAGFGALALGRALVARGSLHLAVLAGHQDFGRSNEGGSLTFQDTRLAALEVLFGPEGGRHLPATPGATLGRYDPGTPTDQPLYQGQPVIDRDLSRRALRWVEGGLVQGSSLGNKPIDFPPDFPLLFGSSTWLVGRRGGS
jgi:hypothetical protein